MRKVKGFSGCVVHTYDHTIPKEAVMLFNKLKNINVHNLGIMASKSKEASPCMLTLEEALAGNGHKDRNITYLKVIHILTK